MRAVDTNILVRLIARDDAKQVVAAESFVKGGAWISMLVLQESLWVLERGYGLERPELAKTVELLLEHDSLVLEGPTLVGEALAEYRGASRVGFSDCLILASARANGHLPLGTFDKRFARMQDVELAS